MCSGHSEMSLNITDSYLNDFLRLTSVKILALKLKNPEISAALRACMSKLVREAEAKGSGYVEKEAES